MSYIKFYRGRAVSSDDRKALFLESDIQIGDYVICKRSQHYSVFSNTRECLIKIGNGTIFSHSHYSIQNKHNPIWVCEGFPEGSIRFNTSDDGYILSNEEGEIARVNIRGDFFEWLMEMWNEKKYFPLERSFRIEFDSSQFSVRTALACLFMIIAEDDFITS